jgi:hypothetical protein
MNTALNNYTLTKTQLKNGKFEYCVIDQDNNVIAKRISFNHYVACTTNGKYFFGRLDLIGKGEQGQILNNCEKDLKLTESEFQNMGRSKYYTYDEMIESCKKTIIKLNTIAYLK